MSNRISLDIPDDDAATIASDLAERLASQGVRATARPMPGIGDSAQLGALN